jgi:hypothetical protein
MGKAKSALLNIAFIGIVCITLAWSSTFQRQKSQFEIGEQALARGDAIAAVAGYEAAIHMYTPGSTLVDKSAEKLWMLGERLERKGETDKALVAYRALRSSFYSIWSLYEPGREWITRCDQKIAKLARRTG